MTALAPGLDAPKSDGGCFNCGSHDHFAYTCPEPVRKEPYGAAVFRQRQADKATHGRGGRASENSRSKGSSIVVTKYAPPPPAFTPPSYYPPPPANAWGQGGPYPPPAPVPPSSAYGQQPPTSYPPQAQPYQPPYPPPVNSGYGPPTPGPPPPPPPPAPSSQGSGGYGPPPPPSAPPYAQYGQYGQAPYQPPPPPPSYGPPGSYPPPAYPPSYPQPDRAYPPPPSQSSYQGPPPPGYQAPPIPPPPPPSFTPGYGAPPGLPPPPGTYPPASYTPNFPPPASYSNPTPPPKSHWSQENGSHHNQRNRDRRDRRNDRDRSNKNKHNRRDNNNNQRGRNHRDDSSSRRPSSTPRERSPKPSPAPADTKTVAPEVEATKADDQTAQAAVPAEDVIAKEDQFDPDQLWDFEKAFVELETKAADPVGKPLAAEWNDMPTIPPAYNAKCIKSEYYDPDNPDAFLASVRDTKYWPTLKRDPVYRFRRGMVTVQFPGSHHEYFTYHCSKKLGASELKEREIVPLPTDETLIDVPKARSIHPASGTHSHGEFPSVSLGGKRNHPEADDYTRDVKRPRNRDLDRSPLPRHRRPSPRDTDYDAGSWAPQPAESPHRPYSRDEYSQSPGGYRLQANGRLVPYDSVPAPRNDSGYHSSSDKHRLGRDDKGNTHLSPPPSVRVRERDASYDRGREWERSREKGKANGRHERERSRSLSRHRPRSRTRSPSRSRSRSRSRTAAADSVGADSADDMDDLEYELLGMQRPETPEKRVVYKPPIKKPRPKVNSAFSRRW